MNSYSNRVGVLVPEVLLPAPEIDVSKWAVVACDQFTAEPEYWEAARAFIGDSPSTLDIFLPEAYLGKPDEDERIAAIRANMRGFVANGVLCKQPQGFVLVRREAAGNTRLGLVLALDLEEYDYSKGSTTLIRATEGTIVDRIPPRLRIRAGATVELPHILVLIDDPDRTVIEPLYADAADLSQLYDADLMMDGGHVTGWLVDDPAKIQNVLDALTALDDPAAFAEKYGDRPPMLFAMGDGNHSFATAKANWEQIKQGLSAEQRETHPARWALVEVENVHDKGIVFEPIHRVLFGVNTDDIVPRLQAKLAEQNGGCEIQRAAGGVGPYSHVLPFVTDKESGAFVVTAPTQQLAVGTLQNAIDALLPELSGSEVDYIHGADVVEKLAARGGAIGFTLPAMRKDEFFRTVVVDGALPRKTFSMGEANEKRYYLECRSIEG
ncbi:MAG: DUF1015 domain-containing protein [Clostridiales bacterium]|nr:DUF1015 domain-containing protein [Clostridiales bacterium]